jgi:uncharacterized protein YdbL (DUF1318 family)
MKSVIFLLVSVIAFGFIATQARAADSKESELKERHEKRAPQIDKLKKAGIVGETADGYLDWVKDKDKKSADVVDEENSDRKEVYKHIAEKTKVSVEQVAERAGKRNFDHASPGEYLKDKNGKWKKKES